MVAAILMDHIYFTDSIFRPTPLECVLPSATLEDGEWIGPNGAV